MWSLPVPPLLRGGYNHCPFITLNMKKALFILAFVSALFLHLGHTACWTELYFNPSGALKTYLQEQDFYLGLAYALAATFTAYSIVQWRANWKLASAGAAGGLSVLLFLQLLGCWLVGCCGSPLLPVYLALLGPSFLPLAKPMVLGITILSIGGSYLWMRRYIERCACEVCPERASEPPGLSIQEPTFPKEAIQQIVNEIYATYQIEKCRYCGCFQQVVGEAITASAEIPLAKDLMDKLLEVKGNIPIARYDCLGCDPCHAATISNTLIETFKMRPLKCEEKASITNILTWPPEEGEYIVGNEHASVAITTLSDPTLVQRIVNRAGTENIAIVGPTLTENIGIEKVVKNIVSNPFIRFLIICGNDPKGHHSGASLLALAENGIDASKRIVGSPAIRPILKNIDPTHVQHFREQVQIFDLMGCDKLDKIGERIKDCAKQNLAPFGKALTMKGMKRVLAKPSKKLMLDPSGYFIVYPKPKDREIVVEHYSNNGTLTHVIVGSNAKEICDTVIELGLLSQLDHATYLGRELERCRLSMDLGFEFIQDKAGD